MFLYIWDKCILFRSTLTFFLPVIYVIFIKHVGQIINVHLYGWNVEGFQIIFFQNRLTSGSTARRTQEKCLVGRAELLKSLSRFKSEEGNTTD